MIITDWLNSNRPDSVVYLCFGSLSNFSRSQLREIAVGLSISPHPYIWVVGDKNKNFDDDFNVTNLFNNTKVLTTDQMDRFRSVGGFVTHCGWNSVLEGVCSDVAMVTWPLGAEQFYNEKLVVDVLGIGVGVGSKFWTTDVEERPIIRGEVIAEAIGRVMGEDDEAIGVRRRAKELGEKGRRAVGSGGSSQEDLDRLIDELLLLKKV